MASLRVLIVDDEPVVARAFSRTLQRKGCRTSIVDSLAGARAQLKEAQLDPYGLVLLDLCLPDGDGADLLADIDSLPVPPIVAVQSAHIDSSRAWELSGRCAVALPKPVSNEVLGQLVDKVTVSEPLTVDVAAFCRANKLSPTESRVVQCRADGKNNSATAAELGCKQSTVATHWRRILRKTGYSSQRDVLSAVLQYSLSRTA